MKISFILVYSSIQNMILMDPKSWSSKDSYYNKTILEFTKKILKQIDSLDIETRNDNINVDIKDLKKIKKLQRRQNQIIKK